MANIKSAKKQAIQSKKRHGINLARKTAVKTALKKVIVALDAGKTKDEILVLFNDAQAQCARAKGKGIFHANTAIRKVSRLALKINEKFTDKK